MLLIITEESSAPTIRSTVSTPVSVVSTPLSCAQNQEAKGQPAGDTGENYIILLNLFLKIYFLLFFRWSNN